MEDEESRTLRGLLPRRGCCPLGLSTARSDRPGSHSSRVQRSWTARIGLREREAVPRGSLPRSCEMESVKLYSYIQISAQIRLTR